MHWMNGVERAILRLENKQQYAMGRAKGLPGPVSPQVTSLIEQWGDDVHSHTWATVDEFEYWVNYYVAYEDSFDFDPDHDSESTWNHLYKRIRKWRKLEKAGYDVRLIMWFDN